MKKLIILLTFISSLSSISCSKDDDSPADDLSGRWYYVSGVSVKSKSASRLTVAEKTVKYIEFKTANVFTQGYQTGTSAKDDSVSSYAKSNNTISITSSKGTIATLTISKLNSNELILIYGKNSGREGDSETYTKNIANATAFY